jgi:hypothetical protein
MATTEGFYYTFRLPLKMLERLLSITDEKKFIPHLRTMVSKLFANQAKKIEYLYNNIGDILNDIIIFIVDDFNLIMYSLYCIVIRYIKEFHTRVELELYRVIEKYENDVAKEDITEQDYIIICNNIKESKEFVDNIVEDYKDDESIYFIKNPDDNDSLTIAFNHLPFNHNPVKYMFNYDMERRRCISLKVKQMEAERKAKQEKDDESLIQAFEEQKTKEKKQSIQDLTRKANKKKAEKDRLRKEYEKSAAEKELEKLKEKKKKQQKKSSKA